MLATMNVALERAGAKPQEVTRATAAHVVGWITCLLLVGYGSIDLRALLNIGGDHLGTLNFAKTYINGDGFRFNTSLGFPGVQDNLAFPSFDLSYRSFMWLFAHVT